jgi:ABC-2 type transport system ATP-binding protein
MTDEDAPEVAVRAEALGYSYGDGIALEDVSFEVAPGEVLVLVGPEGAGKSTIIKMLTGQMAPQQGTVEILGMAMASERRAISTRIGVCFQERTLYPTLTARENLSFFAQLFRVEGFDVDALLDRVGLGDHAGQRAGALTAGMQQRLMVARALVNRPEVLVLDEPTAGLNEAAAATVRTIIGDEAQRGVAVVVATADGREADQLAGRVATIDEGRIQLADRRLE